MGNIAIGFGRIDWTLMRIGLRENLFAPVSVSDIATFQPSQRCSRSIRTMAAGTSRSRPPTRASTSAGAIFCTSTP